MLKGTLLATAAGLALASTVSAAEPSRLTADQMDNVTAGLSLALAAFLTATAVGADTATDLVSSQVSSGSASTEDSATTNTAGTTISAKRSVSARKSIVKNASSCTNCQSAGLVIGVAGTLVTP